MLVKETYGCKVGWATYDNEAEARERAEEAKADAVRRAALGYDFGYSVPGSVTKVKGRDEWMVVLP